MPYGTHGLGKSTFLAGLEGHLILPTEDGLADIDCRHFQVAKTYGDMLTAINIAASELKAGEWFCIDSLDWAYRLMADAVCLEKNIRTLADLDFGKGYKAAAGMMEQLLKQLDTLIDAGINVCCTAHCHIVRFEPPDQPAYDRYEPRLHKGISGMVQEWFDEVLFCNYQIEVQTQKKDFGKKTNKAKGDGTRVMHTREMPTHLAKSRLDLPDVMPFDPAQLMAAINGQEVETVTTGTGGFSVG